MDYVNLGKTGLKVSRLCLGMMSYGSKQEREWHLEEKEAEPFVKRALDAGINFFDTADAYSLGETEIITGNTLKKLGLRRENMIIATKVFYPMGNGPNERGLSRKHIMDAIDASLRRLQMDYVDLYQIHRWDYETPIEETLDALNDIVRAGKARYIGGSSMFAWQFAKALYTSDLHGYARFVSMQNHYNLVYREEEREMIPLCKDQGIGLIPWSPMARGFLTGRYKRGKAPSTSRYKTDKYFAERFFRPEDFDVVERAEEVAKEKGATAAQIALAWLLHKGVNAPIIGATKVEHIDEAVGSVDIQLSDDDMAKLEEPYKPHRILGHS